MVWEKFAKVRRRDPTLAAMPKSISLMWSLAVDHDIFRLQVAMHHAVAVNVVQRRGDLESES